MGLRTPNPGLCAQRPEKDQSRSNGPSGSNGHHARHVADSLGSSRSSDSILGWARGTANDRALRPAAEKGDAEYCREDFDLIRIQKAWVRRWGNSSKPWALLTIRSQATWQRTSRRSINTSSGRPTTTLLFLQHKAAGRIPQRRMGVAAERRRIDHAAGPLGQPSRPVRPPASVVAGRRLVPLARAGGLRAGPRDPVGPLAARRVDDPRDMTAGGQRETHGAAEELGDAPGGVPRHDMVLLRADRIGV